MVEQSLYLNGHCRKFLLLSFLMIVSVLMPFRQAWAVQPCLQCTFADCVAAKLTLRDDHFRGRNEIKDHMTSTFIDSKVWIWTTFFKENLLKAMMMMTEQLSAVGMNQMLSVGMLLDAKTQLETQSVFQEMQARAIHDYQPSEDFCQFGTNIRSFSASETKARYTKQALNKIAMHRHLGTGNAANSQEADKRARWEQFVSSHCQTFNNKWSRKNPSITGLSPACGSSADPERANADVHYSRFFEPERTFDVNFGQDDGAVEDSYIEKEGDIIALQRNLYGHNIGSRNIAFLNEDSASPKYLELRSILAKRNVAENSFISQAAMKSAGTAAGAADTFQYLASIMKNLGITDEDEIKNLIGENPSYYAQLEILAKRIYQDQSFYSNLYDTPENVMRTSVALRAIELMVDRAMFESLLRKEMITSVLLSTSLHDDYQKIAGRLGTTVGQTSD